MRDRADLREALEFGLRIHEDFIARLDRPEYRQIARPGRISRRWPIG